MKTLSFAQIQNRSTIFRAEKIVLPLLSPPVAYYRHGWQSWSLTAWIDPVEPLAIQKPFMFHQYQTDKVYAFEKDPHGSWVGAVELMDGKIALIGALATDAHVFLEQDQLKGRSEAGEIDWFIAHGDEDQVFEEYAAQLKIRFGGIEKTKAPRVWCSWYSLYSTISEKNLGEVFDQLGDLPFDVLQVDDGWQKDIGDWDANEKFPSGMNALAEKIKSTGRMAGLWLAPLLVSVSSKLYRDHKDWLLRDEKGRFVSAGFNYWGHDLYALDVTHPEALDWLVQLMKQVRNWGFDYYKLDFLYAGAVKGRRYKDMPREAAYRNALKIMREAMGEGSFFLTCGTPIIPALGMCDAIRVGPDVSHDWTNDLYERLLQNFSTPSVKNALRTTLNRLWLKPLVHIDPDVEYFAARENTLEKEHKDQLIDLALLCEFKATSDLPKWLTTREREQIREFLIADPKIEKISRYQYKLDNRIVDFSSAVALTPPPTGLAALWGAFLGWAGNIKPVVRIILALDNRAKRIRSERI